MNKILYVSFIAAVFLISCSGIDETTNLGKKIVTDNSQDSLKIGVYNTDTLKQIAGTFGSVVHTIGDTISGMHVFEDSLSSRGNVPSQWAIGNWGGEETILKLSHNPNDTNTMRRILHTIASDTAVNGSTIKADFIWRNITGLNAFDNSAVEVGAIFNGTNFFPLNFVSVNSKNQTSLVPLTIETYLLKESRDSTIIKRFDAKYTNYLDTIRIDSVFIGAKINIKRDTVPNTASIDQEWKSDTLVSWRHFIASSYYDSVSTTKTETTAGDTTIEIKLLSKVDNEQIGRITQIKSMRKNTDPDNSEMIDTAYDTLIIRDIDTTFRTTRSILRQPNPNLEHDIDSIVKIRTIISSKTPDTLIQRGLKYQVALNDSKKGLRLVGGAGSENLLDILTNDTLASPILSMYLRIDKNSNLTSILHLTEPAIRVSYKNNRDTNTIHNVFIYFTDIRIISTPKPNLDDNVIPVISGALERFVKIDLNLSEYFQKIREEQFLSIGLADLTLSLNKDLTDFPAQYGDTIKVNAIIDTAKHTPKTLYALPATRKIETFDVIRGETTVKIPLASTITDFVYMNKVFQNPAPKNSYLYLWLDSWAMGRVHFKQDNPILTYILQTIKDGE